MFWYILGGIVLLVIGSIAFVLYRGYNKVKPKPLDGIPIPPFTHSILGHPDMMLSPLKHILRWEVAERARAAFHQLVMMKHASIFINSAELAKKLFEKLPTKGPIYEIFRYNKMIPDLFSSDGEPWELRSKHLREALTNVKLVPADLETILAQLDTCLKEYSETGKSLAIDQLLMKLCLDIVSMAVFGYKLNALSDSVDGQKIVQCLNTLTEHTSGQGIYANPKARKYSQEDLKLVGSDWRMYLTKMLRSCQAECKEYKSKHGELDVKNKFSHALIHLSEIDASYGEPELLAEIHQVIRHGHEYIQGTLWWGFYVLFKKPEIRAKLENELSVAGEGESVYLQFFLKELLRRYPTGGNLTVRTVDSDDFKLVLGRGIPVPRGTPVHLHMWTLHNTTRQWVKPEEFNPERWLVTDVEKEEEEEDEVEAAPGIQIAKGAMTHPKCPYLATLAATSTYKPNTNIDPVFEGAGFDEDSLSYFPFCVGNRSCPAKSFVITSLSQVFRRVLLTYRLDPYEPFWEDDLGASVNSSVFPLFKNSANVRVSRAVNLGVVPAKKNEGWADDDTQVTVPPQERPILKEKAGSESSSEYEKVEHEDAVDS